jgi:predicted nucleotidyltransferase
VEEAKEVRMHPRLNLDETTLVHFCEQHYIRRLALFGSQLKGTARPDSDIDLLVEFESGWVPGLLALASMELELAELLGGRRVDLRTAEDLSGYFRDEVLHTAEVQYVR